MHSPALPSAEHDACGVGFIAHVRGRAGHDIVAHGLTALPLTDRYTAWYRREQRPMESVPAVAQRWRVPTVTPSAPLTPAEADCPR